MVRTSNRELGSSSSNRNSRIFTGEEAESSDAYDRQDVAARRALRSCYRSVKSRIIDEREEISSADSNKFITIINQLDSLHEQVQKPREQVTDAETLLDITTTMVNCVQAENNGGITVSEFVSCLIRDFGQQNGPISRTEASSPSIGWADIGVAVSDTFRSSCGCSTMIGPMDIKPRERKVAVRRKLTRPIENSQPLELDDAVTKEQTGTDKNMLTMFNILKKNRRVRLENLVLNRSSFAQTVENLFALSFLVKDGRAEIKVDENGCHLVSPRNAPTANSVATAEVTYNHFVFRFDFKDWKLMTSSVGVGEELMPHRNEVHLSSSCQADRANEESQDCQADRANEESQEKAQRKPMRKLSRNRGLVSHEHSVLEGSPENDTREARLAAIRKGKRKVR